MEKHAEESLALGKFKPDTTAAVTWHHSRVFPENLKRKLSSVMTYLEQCQKGKEKAPPLEHIYKTATSFCYLFIYLLPWWLFAAYLNCTFQLINQHLTDPAATAALTCTGSAFSSVASFRFGFKWARPQIQDGCIQTTNRCGWAGSLMEQFSTVCGSFIF